jgi:hypothetical protein
MQQIIIKGYAGMTHMFACIFYALNLSDKLRENYNIQTMVYHDWRGWECFNEIFDVSHSNYNNERFINTKNLQYVIANKFAHQPETIIQVDASLTRPYSAYELFTTLRLKPRLLSIFKEKYDWLNNGQYTAVQFRGSDMFKNKNITLEYFLNKCDITIKEILSMTDNIILLTSDNQDVLLKYVDNKRVFTTSISLDLHDKGIALPIHQKLHDANKSFTNNLFTPFDVCFNSFLDFLLLVHSRNLFADNISGYGQTAHKIHKELKDNPSLRLS